MTRFSKRDGIILCRLTKRIHESLNEALNEPLFNNSININLSPNLASFSSILYYLIQAQKSHISALVQLFSLF